MLYEVITLDPEGHFAESLAVGPVQVYVVEDREEEEEGAPGQVLHGEPVEPDPVVEPGRGPQARVRPHPVDQDEQVERGEKQDEVSYNFV